jgi:uncharacterized protein
MGQVAPAKEEADLCIVDCDVHINDEPRALAPYCDMPWRRALEEMSGPQPDVGSTVLEGPSEGVAPMQPKFPGGFTSRRVSSAAQMREELAALSIDFGILFPDHLLSIARHPSADYAAALARAYNRWMVEEWLGTEPALYGALLAAPQDPPAAAREIEKYADNPKVAAVFLPTSAVYPLYGHRQYDPIFAAAEAASLPVMLHSVAAIHPHFPFNVEQFEAKMARHLISHTFAMMANLVDMITTGVPVRFPNLKVVFTEAGISWVPFIMWRMDKEYVESRREVPFLEDRPSTYIRKMYFATQPIEEPKDGKDLVSMMKIFDGEDQVLFASDWPHHDFDHPRQVLKLPLSKDAMRKVMGGNALRLFGIAAS